MSHPDAPLTPEQLQADILDDMALLRGSSPSARALHAGAAALRASSPAPTGWQAMETAPKDGTHVLTWTKCGVIPASYRTYDQWGMEPGGDQVTPTHWQPLPAHWLYLGFASAA